MVFVGETEREDRCLPGFLVANSWSLEASRSCSLALQQSCASATSGSKYRADTEATPNKSRDVVWGLNLDKS